MIQVASHLVSVRTGGLLWLPVEGGLYLSGTLQAWRVGRSMSGGSHCSVAFVSCNKYTVFCQIPYLLLRFFLPEIERKREGEFSKRKTKGGLWLYRLARRLFAGLQIPASGTKVGIS